MLVSHKVDSFCTSTIIGINIVNPRSSGSYWLLILKMRIIPFQLLYKLKHDDQQ
ncbi:hypothetical protein BVRB_6g127210 [Beta vulgaris subsp. vulgaris]|nr:hypothetical protein BVRB_6g127210 [Beta vulgaris subsp. vulgaris]